MDQDLHAAYTLGMLVAEHAHGYTRSSKDIALFRKCNEILESVAKGELTLLNTASEIIQHLPPPPPDCSPEFLAAFEERKKKIEKLMVPRLAEGVQKHKQLAQTLLTHMPKFPDKDTLADLGIDG